MASKKPVEHPSVRNMSDTQRLQAQVNVAMGSPGKMKEWLQESGRRWLVLDALELVDALPWPHGVKDFMFMLSCLSAHRSVIPSTTGETVDQQDPRASPGKGRVIEVPKGKSETLELVELDRAIRYLIGLASSMDSSWSLENPGL